MLFILLVAGCATRPIDKLTEPAFDMPSRFPDSGDTPLANHWWTAFDDPGLSQLIDYALTHNFTLQSAYARLQQARATVASQRANLFPEITGSAGESATHRSSSSYSLSGVGTGSDATNGTAGGLSFDQDSGTSWSDQQSLGLSASYEVDLFGRIRNGLEADKLTRRARESALQSAAVTLSGNIASQWYQYQEYRDRVALIQDQIETNRNVLELTTYSFNNGQAAAADVLRQRQTVASSQAQLAQAKAQVVVARHALAVLVGRSPSAFDPPPGKLVGLPLLPDTGIPSTLLMRRPDVRQDYFTVAAADREVAVALAARYPQLSLSADYSGSTNVGSLFSNWVLQLGAQLTQPIFDAGQRAAEVRRTRAVVDENVADFQQTLLEAVQEVDDALVNERQQRDYLAKTAQQLKLSKQIVANLRLRYLRGATNYLDVLDALLNRQQLQLDNLSGRYQLLDYRINLYRALAGPIDAPAIGRSGPDTATDQDAGDHGTATGEHTES
ncbi:efflux transporter outer membrane subunit [Salinisphaera sp. SPP-AMP-43]|uniref:efflux transporter outer membrane subunit n=1 Tax=Salinisphaera sp. SPP-AMP-43 TaxID=3121288 RepID=UPI003C6E4B69